MTKRNRNIVIKSQFNINNSRGQNAGNFISDYVTRLDAVSPSKATRPHQIAQPGDAVAFTLDNTAISRDETLSIADRVQDLHQQGNRAIQQMVISFDPDYLINQNLVPENASIRKKGDYKDQYDDIRIRHAIRNGAQRLIENEGYRDGRMVAAIQHDTLHLHVHAVIYENHPDLARKRGSEEKGVIKQSSFQIMSNVIDRNLSSTKTKEPIQYTKTKETKPVVDLSLNQYNNYLLELDYRKQMQKDVEEDINTILEKIEEEKRKKRLSTQLRENNQPKPLQMPQTDNLRL